MAQARVNVYDSIINDNYSYLQTSNGCIEFIKWLPRKDFKTNNLEESTVELSSLKMGTNFFHYTNAEVLKTILHADLENRQEAQKIIRKNNDFDQIFTHVLSPKGDGWAGRGFYLASNPISSQSYGQYQIRITLNPKTRVLTNLNLLDQILFTDIKFKDSKCSKSILKLILLQENNIPLIYFNEQDQWFNLVDDSTIEETRVLSPRDNLDALSIFILDGHTYEISGEDNYFFEHIHRFLKNADEFWAIQKTAKEHHRQDLMNSPIFYPFLFDSNPERSKNLLLSRDPMDIEFLKQIPTSKMCPTFKAGMWDFPLRLKENKTSRKEIQSVLETADKLCP